MKQPINEIKKMQRLAGLITEGEYRESSMNEARNPFEELGYQTGPNRRVPVDLSSQEAQYVAGKINELYMLLNDKNLINFAKGYVDSIGSRQIQYEGLPTVARMMLMAKRDLKESLTNENSTLTIAKIEPGKDTGMAFGALGAGYKVTLSDGSVVESNEDELLDRYREIRSGGRKSIQQLNNILIGKEWENWD
jgi:hypothetical protein